MNREEIVELVAFILVEKIQLTQKYNNPLFIKVMRKKTVGGQTKLAFSSETSYQNIDTNLIAHFDSEFSLPFTTVKKGDKFMKKIIDLELITVDTDNKKEITLGKWKFDAANMPDPRDPAIQFACIETSIGKITLFLRFTVIPSYEFPQGVPKNYYSFITQRTQAPDVENTIEIFGQSDIDIEQTDSNVTSLERAVKKEPHVFSLVADIPSESAEKSKKKKHKKTQDKDADSKESSSQKKHKKAKGNSEKRSKTDSKESSSINENANNDEEEKQKLEKEEDKEKLRKEEEKLRKEEEERLRLVEEKKRKEQEEQERSRLEEERIRKEEEKEKKRKEEERLRIEEEERLRKEEEERLRKEEEEKKRKEEEEKKRKEEEERLRKEKDEKKRKEEEEKKRKEEEKKHKEEEERLRKEEEERLRKEEEEKKRKEEERLRKEEEEKKRKEEEERLRKEEEEKKRKEEEERLRKEEEERLREEEEEKKRKEEERLRKEEEERLRKEEDEKKRKEEERLRKEEERIRKEQEEMERLRQEIEERKKQEELMRIQLERREAERLLKEKIEQNKPKTTKVTHIEKEQNQAVVSQPVQNESDQIGINAAPQSVDVETKTEIASTEEIVKEEEFEEEEAEYEYEYVEEEIVETQEVVYHYIVKAAEKIGVPEIMDKLRSYALKRCTLEIARISHYYANVKFSIYNFAERVDETLAKYRIFSLVDLKKSEVDTIFSTYFKTMMTCSQKIDGINDRVLFLSSLIKLGQHISNMASETTSCHLSVLHELEFYISKSLAIVIQLLIATIGQRINTDPFNFVNEESLKSLSDTIKVVLSEDVKMKLPEMMIQLIIVKCCSYLDSLVFNFIIESGDKITNENIQILLENIRKVQGTFNCFSENFNAAFPNLLNFITLSQVLLGSCSELRLRGKGPLARYIAEKVYPAIQLPERLNMFDIGPQVDKLSLRIVPPSEEYKFTFEWLFVNSSTMNYDE